MICLIFSFSRLLFVHLPQCVRSDSLESMADMTSLGNMPYIPAASDVADMMAQGPPQQQSQQMLNHQTVTNNNNGGNLMGLSMDAMQQQSSPNHSHQQQQQQTINIKTDYGLTAL